MVKRIQELKNLIFYFHSLGICPEVSYIGRLYDGEAGKYLNAMETLGLVEIEDGKITFLAI